MDPATVESRLRGEGKQTNLSRTAHGGAATHVPSTRCPDSKYGSFSAQQAGPGRAIQWGAYPNGSVKATRFVVDVYVGSRRVDHKDQSYAPHGSVSARDVAGKHGQSFTLSGTAWSGSKNTLTFTLRCKIA